MPNDALNIVSAASTLPDPPTSWADVRSWGARKFLQFDLELWADASVGLTGTKLLGCTQKPITLADKTFSTVSTMADTITITGHPYQHGDTNIYFVGATPPAPLNTTTAYTVGVIDANTIQLYDSFDTFMALGSPVNLTSAGSGTRTLHAVNATRFHWMGLGQLGYNSDGVVNLTATDGFKCRVDHSRRNIAYGLVGTPTGALTATVYMTENY